MLLAMRAAFTSAHAHGCCILFIDEIDGVGRRGQGSSRNAYYESMVVNAFMGLVDEIADKGGVILLGATNRLEDIDAAILRSGRLEHRITIEPPNLETRARILQHHLSSPIDLQRLKKLIDGLPDKAASDLELLARKANGFARREGRQVLLEDVKRHLPERILLSEDDLMRIAAHEIGHALVAISTKMVGDVSVEIRGDYFAGTGSAQDGGRTHYEMNQSMLPTEASLLARIRICLGGMVAEEVIYGNRSIGGAGSSGSDLAEATKYATQMVRSFGMGKSLLFEQDWRTIDNRHILPPELRSEVNAIIAKEYRAAKELLAKDKATILRHAAELVVDRRREYRLV